MVNLNGQPPITNSDCDVQEDRGGRAGVGVMAMASGSAQQLSTLCLCELVFKWTMPMPALMLTSPLRIAISWRSKV